MPRFKMTREFYIPKGARKVCDKNSDAVAYLYELNGKPCAKMFLGKQSKPYWAYRFNNDEQRAKRIASTFKGRQEIIAYKKKNRDEYNAIKNELVVGDILRSSWGYDQTNIDYYEVTESKGQMVTIRKIAAKSTPEDGFMTAKCLPLPGEYIGEPMRKKAKGTSVRVASYASAYKMEGKTIGTIKVYEPDRYSWYA